MPDFAPLVFDEGETTYEEWEDESGWSSQGQVSLKTGLKHGLVRRTMANGHIEEAQFRDDQKHGLCRLIFKNGAMTVQTFKDGKEHGLSNSYAKDGALKQREWFENGKFIQSVPLHEAYQHNRLRRDQLSTDVSEKE